VPAKSVVLACAGAVLGLALTGGVLGWTSGSPAAGTLVRGGPSPSIVDTTVRPSPVEQELGVAPVPPRLTGGAGPYGSIVNTGTAGVALTFDDGPDPTWTPRVLAVLREASVKATFCLIGTRAQAHPELVQAIVADGHTLCNHSWNHNTALGSAGTAAIRADLTRTNAAIRAAVPDAPIAYFRQPGGFWTSTVVAVARELGLAPLHWSVDPRDWSRPPVATIVTSVTGSCRDGAVVLLHDGGGNRANTVDAVTRLLPALARSYPLVAMPTGDV
jgi:peptidoglycan/xylan/chitin deacetylase (PgdA/CDA1 family)